MRIFTSIWENDHENDQRAQPGRLPLVYDATVNHIFTSGRKRALALLNLRLGENVLIVGVGTGADFPFLPEGVNATGIDLSPDMIAKRNEVPNLQRFLHARWGVVSTH